jgi:hypothetical protein
LEKTPQQKKTLFAPKKMFGGGGKIFLKIFFFKKKNFFQKIFFYFFPPDKAPKKFFFFFFIKNFRPWLPPKRKKIFFLNPLGGVGGRPPKIFGKFRPQIFLKFFWGQIPFQKDFALFNPLPSPTNSWDKIFSNRALPLVPQDSNNDE